MSRNTKKALQEPQAKNMLKFNLQHFAEGGNPEGDPAGPNPDMISVEEANTQKQQEIAAVIAKERAKQDKAMKDMQEQIQALQQAQDLAGLNEQDKLQKELELEKQKRESLEKEISTEKIKSDALTVLAEKKLDAELVNFVIADDAEKTLTNINTLEEVLNKAITNAVNEKLKNVNPPKVATGDNGEDNPFVTGNLTEQMRLMKQDPVKAEQLKQAAKKQ
jgi:hypothetical protein